MFEDSASQDSNLFCHYGEEVLFWCTTLTEEANKTEVSNAFCLNCLLFMCLYTLLQLRCFHLWEGDLTEKVLIPFVPLILPWHFFHVRNSLRGRFLISWLLLDLPINCHFVVAFKLSGLLSRRMVCHTLIQWGTQLAVTHLLPAAESTD